MTPIKECLINNKTDVIPIWLMRQAGRYLPEFREIRKSNPDFVKLCLNHILAEEITMQPIKRFDFDAAIIFSDILMVPYGVGQKVEFKQRFIKFGLFFLISLNSGKYLPACLINQMGFTSVLLFIKHS